MQFCHSQLEPVLVELSAWCAGYLPQSYLVLQQVVLFGESAGAGSIAVHLTSPHSWRLG